MMQTIGRLVIGNVLKPLRIDNAVHHVQKRKMHHGLWVFGHEVLF